MFFAVWILLHHTLFLTGTLMQETCLFFAVMLMQVSYPVLDPRQLNYSTPAAPPRKCHRPLPDIAESEPGYGAIRASIPHGELTS